MNLKFEREVHLKRFVNVCRLPHVIFGYTELHFSMEDLEDFFHPRRLTAITQIHSDIIHSLSEENIPFETEGDGLIVRQALDMAVIETADCTPLFFWHNSPEILLGGVIHIGWRGLQLGIEKRLIDYLIRNYSPLILPQLRFFLGPSIEASCYEVGPDLYRQFEGKSYRDEIFMEMMNNPDKTKLAMDVKKGIRLSLIESGIPSQNIEATPLCTFCEKERFPSYRRAKGTGQRIHNFLMLMNDR